MKNHSYLALDELNPQVELAGYFQNEHDVWHQYANPGHHLLMATKGRIEALTEDERFVALPGDLICFRPSSFNQYGTLGGTHFFQIHLSLAPPPRHLQPLWLEGIGPLPTHMTLGNHKSRVRELFETVCLIIESPRTADRLRIRAAIEEILALGVDARKEEETDVLRADPWQLIRQRLEMDLHRDIPISRLAKELGITTDHFIRQFRNRFAVSPKRYRILMRLRWAAQSLRSGTTSVKKIASAVGVSDATAFTRLFRRHFGVSPTEMMTTPSATSKEEDFSKKGIIMNRHLLRPQSPVDWEQKFIPRSRR